MMRLVQRPVYICLVQMCVLGTVGGRAIAQTPSPSMPSPDSVNEAIAPSSSRPVLQLGSEGEEVAEIQAMLTLLGFYDGPVSGRFGEQTEAAVTRFQRAANLTADGIVGAGTWNSLLPATTRVDVPPSPQQSTDQPTDQSPEQAPNPPSNLTATPAVETSEAQPRPTSSPSPDSSDSSASTDSTDSEAIPYVEYPVLRRGMRGAAVLGLQEKLSAIGVYNGPIDGIFGAQTEAAVIAAQRRLNLTQDGVVGSATWTAILELNQP